LDPAERFVTIAHELGHIFLGHLGECESGKSDDDESGWPDRRWLGKSEKEVEAEAVAFLVASRASVITASAQYLKDYAARADMTKMDLDLIVRSAARIERMAKIRYGSMAFKPPS
jgi:Zn-dependent peptidase ImmA (M78 family)